MKSLSLFCKATFDHLTCLILWPFPWQQIVMSCMDRLWGQKLPRMEPGEDVGKILELRKYISKYSKEVENTLTLKVSKASNHKEGAYHKLRLQMAKSRHRIFFLLCTGKNAFNNLKIIFHVYSKPRLCSTHLQKEILI